MTLQLSDIQRPTQALRQRHQDASQLQTLTYYWQYLLFNQAFTLKPKRARFILAFAANSYLPRKGHGGHCKAKYLNAYLSQNKRGAT